MKELIIRTATGITLVVLFIGSILLGPAPMLIMMLVVYSLGVRELFGLMRIPMRFPTLLMAVSGALLIVGVWAGLHLLLHPLWLLLPISAWIVGYLWPAEKNPGPLVLFWIALPLATFIALGWFPAGSWSPLLPVSVVALVWINDTFAYISGSLLGKHPMTPVLSPGKTWEGFAGGILFTMLSGWAFYHFTGLRTPAIWISAGAAASLFGVAGDLFESGLKRKCKVKNTSSLLPGHGGVLDRFDSLLFVAPAVFFILLLIQLFE